VGKSQAGWKLNKSTSANKETTMLKRNLRDYFFRFDESMKNLSFFLLYAGGLLYKESRAVNKPFFFKRLPYYLKGYTTESWRLYSQSRQEHDIGLYVSDYQRYNKAPRVNDRYGILLANKNLFTSIMAPYQQYLPQVYAEIMNGRIVPLQATSPEVKDIDSLLELLDTRQAVALKSSTGYGGLGFHVCMKVNGILTIDNEPADRNRLESLITSLDNYIICEYIIQASYARDIFAPAANTIRILTILDPHQRSVTIAAAAHRFGTRTSYPVDNFTRGGLSTSIDLQTGTLGLSAAHTEGGKMKWLEHHPDTNAKISGIRIPRWKETCDTICKLAAYLHYCPLIGWDIVITDSGLKIIEANDSPGVDFLQIHQPLLLNPDMRDFFMRYGILNRAQQKTLRKHR